MKNYLLGSMLLAVVMTSLNSCSSNTSGEIALEPKTVVVVDYTYTPIELETMALINEYRENMGLNALKNVNYISVKSEGHDNYMISNNVVNHDGFVDRSNNIIQLLDAKVVGENVAYNFSTPEAVVAAWLKSPAHKENIVGNFTHFGIAIRENPTTGRKYYTNIFAKI